MHICLELVRAEFFRARVWAGLLPSGSVYSQAKLCGNWADFGPVVLWDELNFDVKFQPYYYSRLTLGVMGTTAKLKQWAMTS